MPSLDKKILTMIKSNKVVKEAADASDAQDDKGGTHVKPTWTDLGAAIVSPTQGDHPDYTRGVPSQHARPMDKPVTDDISGAKDNKGKVTTAEVDKPGDGPKLAKSKEVMAEETANTPLIEAARRQLKKFNEDFNFDKKDDKEKDDKDGKDDKKDDKDKKDDVKEDTGADSENQRQHAKVSQGEPMHKLDASKLDAPAAATTVKEDDKKDDKDKKDIEEDISALFAGETVTEAFKKKAALIFETAIGVRVNAVLGQKTKEITEAVEAVKAAEVETIKEALATKVDTFLNYVAEQWVSANALPIENTIRASIAEDFIAGLKTLFENHYIEIPASKVDVVATLADRVEKLEEQLNNQITSNAGLAEENRRFKREQIVSEVTEGLVAAQADKLKTLAENVEFKDAASFKESLTTLKESYNGKDKAPKAQNLTEEKTTTTLPPTPPKTGRMSAYLETSRKLSGQDA